MGHKRDELKNIEDIAADLGLNDRCLIPYGRHIAKIDMAKIKSKGTSHKGRLILVTGMNPPPTGDGKTTLTIGITQALRGAGRSAVACIRQPSLGPLFGSKGAGTGGGMSRAEPNEDISLQFTGDDDAITNANNLISALIDNHIYHGNALNIDPKRITWPRVSTLTDRALRSVRTASQTKFERQDNFRVSAASELMSILCLATDLSDVKRRISRCLVAYDRSGRPVLAKDLKAIEAPAALLRNAVKPNLVQSIESAPVFIHTGPFGNISIGCSSVAATKLALNHAEFVLTEAGFSTELGAEKFFDILCRSANLAPSGAVIVATLKAIRTHGIANLRKHCSNVDQFGVPFIVAINRFAQDDQKELGSVINELAALKIKTFTANVFEQGGKGAADIAGEIANSFDFDNSSNFKFLYDLGITISEKLERIARTLYGADGIDLSEDAEADIHEIEENGWGGLPVCVAKTPRSLSDDPLKTGVPANFKVQVNRLIPSLGAGFIVAVCGNILLMPGLPEHPKSDNFKVSDDGTVTGI